MKYKKETLIGLKAYEDAKFSLHGIVKDIYKDENGIWQTLIEDPNDGDTELVYIYNVIFEYPTINLWEFEYYNSKNEIDGDEKFFKETLWLDSKLSKEDVIKLITEIYSIDDFYTFFSLRNLKIIDSQTRELKLYEHK